jgi:hypothetical protein
MNRWTRSTITTTTTTTGTAEPAVADFGVGARPATEPWSPPPQAGVSHVSSIATAPEHRDFTTTAPPPPNHQPTRFISSAAYLDSLSARPMASSSTGNPQWDEPRREPVHWSTAQQYLETPLTSYAAHDASTILHEAQLSEHELRANLSYLESVTSLERNLDTAAMQVDASVATLPDTSNVELPWGTPSLQHQLDESEFAAINTTPAVPTLEATAPESVPTTARSSFWGASSPWNGNASPLGSSSYLCAISRESSSSF